MTRAACREAGSAHSVEHRSAGKGCDRLGVLAQNRPVHAVPGARLVSSCDQDLGIPQDSEMLGYRGLGEGAFGDDLPRHPRVALGEELEDPDPRRMSEALGDASEIVGSERDELDRIVVDAFRWCGYFVNSFTRVSRETQGPLGAFVPEWSEPQVVASSWSMRQRWVRTVNMPSTSSSHSAWSRSIAATVPCP